MSLALWPRSVLIAAALAAVPAGCGSNAHDGKAAAAGDGSGPGRTWSAAQALEEDHSEEDNHPSVALNAAGDGVVAWQRGQALWVRRYDATQNSFGAASQVSTASRYDDLQVGIDAQGNAMLVWARDDTDDTRGIWWSRSTHGGGSWSTPKAIAFGNLYRSRLAVSAVGTALAAWTERAADNVRVSVGSSDFRDGDWNPVVNVPRPGTGLGDRNPRVAVDGQGRGFLIWEQPAAVNENSRVWSERYDGGWLPESVAPLDSYLVDDSYTPTLALNETGEGTAIWLQRTDLAPQLWARRFDGGSWGEPERLAGAPLIEWDPPPQVAVDPAGSSVALWSEVTRLEDIPQYYHVHAVHHLAGDAHWQAPARLETHNLIGADLTEYTGSLVGLDGDGNALATWRKELPSSRLTVVWSRLRADSAAWAPDDGAPLNDDPTRSALATDLAVSRNGTALAAWSYGPEFDIWVSAYR